MADKKNIYKIYDDQQMGTVIISDNVMSIIAALAALEVEGIASMRGDINASQITRSEMNKISKCVKIIETEGKLRVQLVLNIKYGYNLPDVTKKVQAHVKDVLENMTGLEVESVNISISDVLIQKPVKTKAAEKAETEEE